jgi:hypothetical protein
VSLVAIYEQMALQIRTAVASSDWDFQVEHRPITSPSLPCIDMYRGEVSLDDAASFGSTVEDMRESEVVVVRARVSTNDAEAMYDVLITLADPSDAICLVQSVYDDPTLDGRASDVHLLSDSGLTMVVGVDGSTVHYGNVWRFLVLPAWS